MTIHSDGFNIYPSPRKGPPPGPAAVGCGYTLCDFAGRVLAQAYTYEAHDHVLGEISGIMAAVQMAKENDSVVSDSTEAVSAFNESRLTKLPDATSKILLLSLRIKSIRENIQVSWRGREALTAGHYNELNPIRKAIVKCTCHAGIGIPV